MCLKVWCNYPKKRRFGGLFHVKGLVFVMMERGKQTTQTQDKAVGIALGSICSPLLFSRERLCSHDEDNTAVEDSMLPQIRQMFVQPIAANDCCTTNVSRSVRLG